MLEKLYQIFNDVNQEYNCFEYIYSRKEAEKLGADLNCTFMLEANKGYYFLDPINDKLIKELTEDEIKGFFFYPFHSWIFTL